MGKRQANEDDMEISSIREHLDRQDKTMQEILVVIRGSVGLGVDGVLSQLKEIRECNQQIISDVAHLQRYKKNLQDINIVKDVYDLKQWRKDEERKKLTLFEIFKLVSAAIVMAATILGALLALKQLLEK